MKNVKLLIGLLLLAFVLVSCDGDDNKQPDKVAKNYFKLGDKEYFLSKGSSSSVSSYPIYFNDIILYSSGLTLKQTDEGPEFEGSGDFVGFLFASFKAEIPVGTYVFNSSNIEDTITAFEDGVVGVSYNSDLEDDNGVLEFESGKISISKNGDIYTINFDCEEEKGRKVKGFYKGKLPTY